ncbi:unnamed protein product [marine sediment metagenome]|uniref:Uncharacterized protein n=1 Tax=marine sediment metagenome TaxID=412755 RepID=X1UTX0_9ZZZZ
MEEQREETLGMKDTVEAEVTKGGVKGKYVAAAVERDKAIALAHDKYAQATEAARKEYVEAKERINREFEEKLKELDRQARQESEEAAK